MVPFFNGISEPLPIELIGPRQRLWTMAQPCDASFIDSLDRHILWSIRVGPWLTSTKISQLPIPPGTKGISSEGAWLSWNRFWVIRVPWASQSHQIPIAACSLMPATSAPASSCILLIWWMWLSSITENTPPILPTIPVCSQWWIWHLRIIWLPIFSFVQPWYCPLQTASLSICVALLTCLLVK